jgi:hypothetical protein
MDKLSDNLHSHPPSSSSQSPTYHRRHHRHQKTGAHYPPPARAWPPQKYMKERFRWTNDMVASVNWEAFSRTFHSCYRFRVFTFKLCFWQLPTSKTLRKRSPCFDPKCPACDHASECSDHIFQCKALSRRRWQSSFIQSTRERAKACNTGPKHVQILIAGIRSYFDSCSPLMLNLKHTPLLTANSPLTKQPSAGVT